MPLKPLYLVARAIHHGIQLWAIKNWAFTLSEISMLKQIKVAELKGVTHRETRHITRILLLLLSRSIGRTTFTCQSNIGIIILILRARGLFVPRQLLLRSSTRCLRVRCSTSDVLILQVYLTCFLPETWSLDNSAASTAAGTCYTLLLHSFSLIFYKFDSFIQKTVVSRKTKIIKENIASSSHSRRNMHL